MTHLITRAQIESLPAFKALLCGAFVCSGEHKIRLIYLLFFSVLLTACRDETPWNNPNQGADHNIRYMAFTERPKSLDPARAYSLDEMIFTAQIYTPPLQYHYLKRPYTLVPFMAAVMPKLHFVSAPQGGVYSVYDIYIKPGMYYQEHPAFAKDAQGHFIYYPLSAHVLDTVHRIQDFKQTATRELVAEDYVYEIKRLAEPGVNSPIFGFMQKYILGLADYDKQLPHGLSQKFLDLRDYPLAGAKVIDRYHYQIIIKGKYPQFQYWLAMNFFAPIPWEADAFYSQPGMAEKNLGFDWYPVGAGPYQLIENNPNRHMVLARNPHYQGEYYPGLSQDTGQSLPFIDKVVFSLDKETIPRWYKFLQGYYDVSAISSDNFDQAIVVDAQGKSHLTQAMREKNIHLQTAVVPTLFYVGFNMLDKVVGGDGEKARKLRQAISIALDYEEYIAIFLNGRGRPGQGPIPPGIFGNLPGAAGMNPVVYDWVNGAAKRKPIEVAKRLLVEAGYPKGRDVQTGRPLMLNFDTTSSSAPDDKARFDWLRKQFAKLGIELQIRSTDYNRFREKIRIGEVQLFFLGWIADYPDPENFLFLFYGPGSKVKFGGENVSNYNNPKFDALFTAMGHLKDGPERQALINQMVSMLREDSPFVWAYYPEEFELSHAWNSVSQLNPIANNGLKYQRIDFRMRAKQQALWNQPKLWPLWVIILGLAGLIFLAGWYYWKQQGKPGIKRFLDRQ